MTALNLIDVCANMSCISNNFSSFFLNSLNDPSEFSKYLSNGELRFSSSLEDFPGYGQQQQQQQQQLTCSVSGQLQNGEILNSSSNDGSLNGIDVGTQSSITSSHNYISYQAQSTVGHLSQQQQHMLQQRWPATASVAAHNPHHHVAQQLSSTHPNHPVAGAQHFDGSFEFLKYLRHSNDYHDGSHDPQVQGASNSGNSSSSAHATNAVGTKHESAVSAVSAVAVNASLIDLDSSTTHKASRSSRKSAALLSSVATSAPTPMAIDVYDHDSKHTIFDLQHMTNATVTSAHSSNSNESSMELSSLTYPNSHLNASNSNTSSEGGTNGTATGHADFSMISVNGNTAATSSPAVVPAAAASTAPKPLATFAIKENFDVHSSHKIEEGIFQHMNKLPPKKKDNLRQLGVRFTGQMTLNDKSIIVDNFIRFCQ
uniref:Uncharacterized protein n=1 Tax=Glossina morsitans morsitans TaxID=37546 RepID=A0A1B0G495_GLOMM